MIDCVWDIEEFFDAIMSTPAVEPPAMRPLAHQMPEATSRELPGGRGFLRVVKAPGAPSTPVPTPAAPAQPVGQLGLFDKPEEPA